MLFTDIDRNEDMLDQAYSTGEGSIAHLHNNPYLGMSVLELQNLYVRYTEARIAILWHRLNDDVVDDDDNTASILDDALYYIEIAIECMGKMPQSTYEDWLKK